MGFKKDRGVNLLEEIVTTAKEILPEVETKIEEPEEPETPEAPEEKKEIVTTVSKPEVKNIIRKKKKVIKKRVDTKPVINCGITGDTIEVRDFRAIIKKKGLQINVVLNGIIAEWNHTNYNL
jgi:hypothetical protein